MSPSGTPHHGWRALLEEVRDLASRTGTGRSKLLRKLNELEAAVDAEIYAIEDARRRRVVGPRARVRAAVYTVEDSPRGPALTERRDSDARPFKCPKPVYNAVARAVGSTPEPQTFQTIKRHAQRQIDGPLADYAVRTPLRYWSVLGLVHHDQARFTRVGTKAEFTRRVRDAWKTSSRQEVHTDPDSCGQLRGRNSKS